MISMILESDYRIAFISDVSPYHKAAGMGPDAFIGAIATDWIAEGVEEWKSAIDETPAHRTPQTCEIVNIFKENRSRWRCTSQFFERGRVFISAANIPYHLNALSNREWDILAEIATNSTNAQIASKLVISVSTVEKHRNRIRKRLEIQDDSQLRLTAWVVLNPDSLHAMP